MKYVTLIFLLTVSFNSFSQSGGEWKFPFRVLYAENCKNNRGQNLKSLDTVAINDIITIGEMGTLSLVHYTGFPIELSNDTIIEARAIHNLIDPESIGKKKKKDISRIKLDINYLFISDEMQAKRKTLSMTGACFDCGRSFEIFYPVPSRVLEVNYQDELYLRWYSDYSKSFQISLQNLFADTLKKYTTTSNSLTIEAEEMKNFMDSETEKGLILEISSVEKNMQSRLMLVREFSMGNLEFPYPREPKKATFALMAGFYTEIKSPEDFDEAYHYYELATKLSAKPFYKEMLDNFNKRHKK